MAIFIIKIDFWTPSFIKTPYLVIRPTVGVVNDRVITTDLTDPSYITYEVEMPGMNRHCKNCTGGNSMILYNAGHSMM